MKRRRTNRNAGPKRPKQKLILRKFQRFMQKKLAITSTVIVLALFALCVRTIYIYVISGDKYSITVLNQQEYISKVLPYKRGEILDRNGNSLATSIKVYNLVIDSRIILSNEEYLEPTINAVNKYLGSIDANKMISDIKSEGGSFDLSKLVSGIKQREKNSYWVVMKQLTYEEVKGFIELLSGDSKEDDNTYVKGVWFEEEYKRMYPFESLACSVIGFANKDGSADIGIEAFYADELTGVVGICEPGC